jgi:hypothetical protein
MARLATIVLVVITGIAFGLAVPLLRLFNAAQPMMVALSIMIAAIFVRLNRGMPTLEWKSIDPDGRHKLTSNILELAKDYGWIIAANALTLLVLVVLTAIGKGDAGKWPAWGQHVAAGTIGALGSLCVARMAYVVWRDIDVVRLQKHLIDGLATKESIEREGAAAENKVADIRSAGARKIEVPPPKAWGD